MPIFDHFDADSLSFPPGTGLTHNSARLDRLGPGLSYLITHCAEGGAELEGITRDWQQRDEEHRIYSDGSMSRAFESRRMRTARDAPAARLDPAGSAGLAADPDPRAALLERRQRQRR